MRPTTRFFTFWATAAALVMLVSSMGLAISSGIDEDKAQQQAGSIAVGCTCHSEVPTGSVGAILEGVPGVYGEPTELGGAYEAMTYPLTVRITGGPQPGSGGYNLHVSHGTLAVVDGDSTSQITEMGDATHTAPSESRMWNLTWTAPDDPSEAVVFRLTVNAVNGDRLPGPDDQWNRGIFVSQGAGGATVGAAAEEHALHVETLGVNWLAYWVGIASFIFMIVIMFVYYFVFRYSETSHTTDHRNRKKKAA